jgi:hypothetical protein
VGKPNKRQLQKIEIFVDSIKNTKDMSTFGMTELDKGSVGW